VSIVSSLSAPKLHQIQEFWKGGSTVKQQFNFDSYLGARRDNTRTIPNLCAAVPGYNSS